MEIETASMPPLLGITGETRLAGGGNRIRTIGSAPAKGSSGRCQSETAARRAEPLTGSGPRRQCLPGVAPHSLSLRGGTASSNPSSSIGESAANLTSVSLRDRDRSARFEFQPGGATRIRKAESGGALAGALDRPYRPKPAQSASATTAAHLPSPPPRQHHVLLPIGA